MKKLLTNTIFILLLLLPEVLQAKVIQLRIPDSTIAKNSFVNLPIYADSSLTGEGVVSYQLQINYNNAILSFESIVTNGTITQSAGFSTSYNKSGTNQINIAGAGSNALSGSGALIYLRFKAINSGRAYVNFTDVNHNFFNEGNPQIKFVNAYINVPVPVTINISPDSRIITVGDKLQFYVSGGTSPYRWSVTNPAVASINNSGLLTAKEKGFTKVIVEDTTNIIDTTTGLIEIRGVKLSIPDTSLFQNTTFNLPVYINNITNLNILSGKFTLSYNQNVVEAVDVVQTGSLMESFAKPTIKISTGKIAVAFSNTTPLSGGGVLLFIKMKISPSYGGSTALNLSDILFNEDILSNIKNGSLSKITLSQLRIYPTSGKLLVGDSLQFSGSGGKPPYSYSLTDSNLASINSGGKLKAVKGGNVKVILTDSLGNNVTSSDINIYDIKVFIDDTTAVIGDTLVLPIYLNTLVNSNPISSFKIVLNYSNAFFEPVGFQRTGTLSDDWPIAYNKTSNQIIIAAASSSSFNNGNIIIKILLKTLITVNKNQATNLTFSEVTFNEGDPRTLSNGCRITFKPESGIVPPDIPELVSPKDKTNKLSLSPIFKWNQSVGTTFYTFQLASDNTFNNMIVSNNSLTDTTYQADSLIDGSEFYWRVNARNSAGASNFSTIRSFSTKLNSPDSLNVVSNEYNKITLQWIDNSGSEKGYFIERKSGDISSPNTFMIIDSVGPNIQTYTDTTFQALSVDKITYRVFAFNDLDSSSYSNLTEVTRVTGINDFKNKIPTDYFVSQNYPNPFNPSTTIMYSVPVESRVVISIYNSIGEIVANLEKSTKSQGNYFVTWNAGNRPSGIYFYSILAASIDGNKSYHVVRKMLLIK